MKIDVRCLECGHVWTVPVTERVAGCAYCPGGEIIFENAQVDLGDQQQEPQTHDTLDR